MRNVPIYIWFVLVAALGLAVYYYNQYKKEKESSSGSTRKNFSGTNGSVTLGEIIDKS